MRCSLLVVVTQLAVVALLAGCAAPPRVAAVERRMPAACADEPPHGDPYDTTKRDGSPREPPFEVEVFPVETADIQGLATALRHFVRPRMRSASCALYPPGRHPEPDRSEEIVVVDEITHSLVVTGTPEQIDRLWHLLIQFDAPARHPASLDREPRTRPGRPRTGAAVAVAQPEHADAGAVADVFRQLAGIGADHRRSVTCACSGASRATCGR